MCVPSSFFIGDNGIPLEVIAGSVSVEELVTRIRKVKQVMLAARLDLSNGVECAHMLKTRCPWPFTCALGNYELLVLYHSNNKICKLKIGTQIEQVGKHCAKMLHYLFCFSDCF